MAHTDSFQSHASLTVAGKDYRFARLTALADQGVNLDRLPFAIRILLENLLRREDADVVPKEDVLAVANWQPNDGARAEIAYMPARVLLQDFTGVPAVVDLAAMRDAMAAMGHDAGRINPLQPVELVIDHSVQVDSFASEDAQRINSEFEFERNKERYAFLRWGQGALANFKAVPPETGIVHQVNLEYLARGVMTDEAGGSDWLYPDTLVGTDSHTTMINGLGVLGWGVGGIEAEAAMLGQPISMLIPDVVGMRLTGKLPEGATATDMVLRIVELLRAHGVVGKFVEFFGPALGEMSLADRATIANMAPEYGATCGLFPVDGVTVDYLRKTGRPEEAERTEAYYRAQGLFHDGDAPEAEYTAVLDLDLSTIVPALAGPKRPQDRIDLTDTKAGFAQTLVDLGATPGAAVPTTIDGEQVTLDHGKVVIAAITSCTNTSNPSVLMAAGLVAKKAAALGLERKPWVKTSLAPGSKVVTKYLERSGLMDELEKLGFHVVGYGCTTCIGNSGPLPEPVAKAITEGDLVATSVLSGNRNFEGRVHQLVKANYLASPPLVVAYAIAGSLEVDLTTEPLGIDSNGQPVFLKDIWPSNEEVAAAVAEVQPAMFSEAYADVYTGPEAWQKMPVPEGQTFAWDTDSTYVQHPPFFQGVGPEPAPFEEISGARVLLKLGDSVTTDHISPAGAIKPDSPAGSYLTERGVQPKDFNSYGSRRGNHEVMMRGTFANIRIKNQLVPGTEGGVTVHFGSGDQTSVYDAAMRYQAEGTPTIVLAGAEYGTGSSRDWAAKGPKLLGVRAVIATSFERIHRSNLIGMGIVPLEFPGGKSAADLGLDGTETFAIENVSALLADYRPGATLKVVGTKADGSQVSFDAPVRIDTPQEARYVAHGGILQFVLRQLAGA